MAPLNFRVWDKNGKWMAVGARENFDDMIAWRFRHWEPETDGKEGLPDVVVMQSTGLRDRNGVEVFEGDIVRFKWNPIFNDPSEIFEWEQPVEYDDVWGCFVMRIRNGDGDEVKVAVGSPKEVGQDIEVIGNRYQHPELIGGRS